MLYSYAMSSTKIAYGLTTADAARPRRGSVVDKSILYAPNLRSPYPMLCSYDMLLCPCAPTLCFYAMCGAELAYGAMVDKIGAGARVVMRRLSEDGTL
eukprot:260171-Rhodomonas_salina.1